MVQKVQKARKVVERCNVCGGRLQRSMGEIQGMSLAVFKCVDCGEAEVPLSEALKLEKSALPSRKSTANLSTEEIKQLLVALRQDAKDMGLTRAQLRRDIERIKRETYKEYFADKLKA